jgi:hypothetical protein
MKQPLAAGERSTNRQARRTHARRIMVLAICLLALVGCSSVRPVVDTSPVIAVVAMSGTPQAHEVNGAFGSPLVAMVTNNGSPAAGVAVTFTAPTTGAGGTFANGKATATATTDASGLATTALFTANGTAGTYSVTALASGATTPASFTLTNTIGAPAAVQVPGGITQSAQINGTFPSFMVKVVDGGGNPVSNAVVTFTASTSSSGASGTFASNGTNTETDTSAANGIATSSAFTANGTSGSYALNVAVGTVSINITLTNSAGAPASITATSGTPQSAKIVTAFAAPLVVTVQDGATPPNPVSGVAVTFAAPTSGATGTFANGQATETVATISNGTASATFTANSTTGSYMVNATISAVTGPAVFNLTNQVASNTYVFYLSGQGPFTAGTPPSSPSYYALAGAVQIDGSGNVLDGEQDYNAGGGTLTSPEPGGDTISSGSLTVDPTTGQGTLTLNTSNTSLGVAGVETLGVQFVNSSHALITEFDGTGTSSGSMDLQATTSLPTGGTPGYAFTLSGVDSSLNPIGFGGVFTTTPTTGGAATVSGVFDTNDTGSTPILNTSFTGTLSAPDFLGRGTLTGLTNPVLSTSVILNYYVLGPANSYGPGAIRLIDVDTLGDDGSADSAVGSAFGQGSSGFSNASLGNTVFGINGTVLGAYYSAAGMFTPTGGTFSGVGDVDELVTGAPVTGASITGTYSIPGTPNNGYGSLTISPALGDVSVLGIYMTDPSLDLLDPNNTTTGNAVGGGLIADMDALPASNAFLAGGTGFLIPQTDTSTTDFNGTYTFGAQAIDFGSEEFDFVGVGSVSSSQALAGTGSLSDPFLTLNASQSNSSVAFSGTATPDASHAGRYTMLSPNSFDITIGTGTPNAFDVVLYQANGQELLWINEDASSVFFGSLQVQGSLAGLPTSAARKPGANAKAKRRPRQ